MKKRKPSGTIRVTWSTGDKTGVRQQWARRCSTFCRTQKRHKAAALVHVLAGYLNVEHGYAWPTNDQLRLDMGDKHVSAVERAMGQLVEMRVIECDTRPKTDDMGKIVGRNRRIYPCWPPDLDQILNRRQTPAVSPNPENASKNQEKSEGSLISGERSVGIGTTEPRQFDRRTPNRAPSHSGNKEDTLCNQGKNSIGKADRFSCLSAAVRSIVEPLAYIGPGHPDPKSEPGELMHIGRLAWTAIKRRAITGSDADTVLAHLRDAARRSWLDHRQDVGAMLGYVGDAVVDQWPPSFPAFSRNQVIAPSVPFATP